MINMKILLVHLPKTAGTVLSWYARAVPEFEYYLNNGQAHYPASSVVNRQEYFIVGFVRNPWDWYVSRYHYFTAMAKQGIEKGVSKYADAGLPGKHFVQKFPTLKDHLMFGLSNECKAERFWMSQMYQYMFCDRNSEKLLLNFVGRTENLNEDMDTVFELIKTSPSISFKNFLLAESPYRNSSEHNHYSQYYDQELIDLVQEKDGDIVQQYDYQF